MTFPSPLFALGQGVEVLPFLGAICFGGFAGFVLGFKKRSWLLMVGLTIGLAAFGFWLIGLWGLIAGVLTPPLYLYGRYA